MLRNTKKHYTPQVGVASKVTVDKTKLKSGCVVEAEDDEVLYVVGHIAPRFATSGEEELRLRNLAGERVGIANISAVTVIS